MAEARLPFVSVVVPARNAEATIGRCLTSLLRADYDPDRREILVVDNGSTDRTAQIVAFHPVRRLFEPRRGPSAARNCGILAACGEIVAFTDADCVVTTGWLRALVGGFDSPEVWGVAGEIVAYPPTTPAQRYLAVRTARWQDRALRSRRPFPVTSNVAFRRETFERIGLFDPALIKAQDKDFGWRFFGADGLRLAYRPDAVVLHRHRPTTWELFTQHVGWGYGAALLHRKYGLPWSLRLELTKQRELALAVGTLVAAAARYRLRGGDRMDALNAAYEVVRRLGLRAGALFGLGATSMGLAPRSRQGR